MEPYLLEFYGLECPHCKKMEPLVEKLENEFKIKVEKIEVWHNEVNARKMENYDIGLCGGVPFFYNVRSQGWLCGEVDYEVLKQWAEK